MHGNCIIYLGDKDTKKGKTINLVKFSLTIKQFQFFKHKANKKSKQEHAIPDDQDQQAEELWLIKSPRLNEHETENEMIMSIVVFI